MESNSDGSGFIFVYLLETTEDSSSVDLARSISTLPGVEQCVTHSYPEREHVAFLRAKTSSDKGSDVCAAIKALLQHRGVNGVVAPPKAPSSSPLPEGTSLSAVLLSVKGMTCHSCVKLIESTLGSEPGVATVNVSLGRKEAIVQYSESQTSTDVISTVIYDMGFDVEKIMDLAAKPQPAVAVMMPSNQPSVAVEIPSVITLSVEGMVCMSCVNNIQTNVGAVVGVDAVHVSLEGHTAAITYRPSVIGPDELVRKVEELGFEASVAQSGGEKSLPTAMRTGCNEKEAGISEKETVTVLSKIGDHNEV